jgi:Icc-related predicted phosphoesterase
MRILCVADLHYRKNWFDWVTINSVDYDLTSISGDLLYDSSVFGASTALPDWDGGRTPQLRLQSYQLAALFREHIEKSENGIFALCSGNHDPVFLWNADDGIGGLIGPRMISDGETRFFPEERVAITSIPYELKSSEFEHRWIDAHNRARAQNCFWIVFSHEGPTGSSTMLNARGGQPLRQMIESHPADLLIHGHIHRAPWEAGGSWHAKIGRTLVLNPGSVEFRASSPSQPPFITVDTSRGVIFWHGTECEEEAQSLQFDSIGKTGSIG